MFCPWCGSELRRRSGELVCEQGAMALSRALETLLTEAIEKTPVERLSLPPATADSSLRFCPRCQHGLVKLSADSYALAEQCPQCSLTLTSAMIYGLVKVHPHQGIGGFEPD